MKNCNLSLLLKEIVFLFSDYVKDQGKLLKFDPGRDLAHYESILIDGKRVQQVFYNMIYNASKMASDSSRINVRISFKQDASQEDYFNLVITVSHTGESFTEEEVCQLFDPSQSYSRRL